MGADTGSGDSCAQCGLQVYHAEAVATGREVQILQITVDNRYADIYNINVGTDNRRRWYLMVKYRLIILQVLTLRHCS